MEPYLKYIKEFSKDWDISVKVFTPYHYRLTREEKPKIICDIYHVNSKFHIIKHPDNSFEQSRGDIVDIGIFLETVFCNY